ncbi:MAG: ankyrin repeat domain-containing protein, partial [Alphaproteobacteria bacterium]|nr:ankyrin repeat domain-containing protein [Alphaproteobacteria bacterium]
DYKKIFSECNYNQIINEIYKDLERGIDINSKDKYGRTVLMYVVIYNRNPEVIEKLVELGADVNEKDNYEYTPLIYAVDKNTNPEFLNIEHYHSLNFLLQILVKSECRFLTHSSYKNIYKQC